MQIIQLNPSIPMNTPKGKGLAIMAVWLSEEHNWIWTIALDESGEIWDFQNPEVRMQKNITMGRLKSESKIAEKYPIKASYE